MSELNAKQRRFCKEYVIDLNGTQAAIRAGYSKKTAGSQSFDLLKKPEIQAKIKQLEKTVAERLGITHESVLKELKKLAFSDMRKLTKWGENGVTLIDSSQIDDDSAACVAEVSQTITKDGGGIKFKLHDKKGALEDLGRHLSMFVDKVDHSNNDGSLRPVQQTIFRFHGITREEYQAKLKNKKPENAE